MSGTVTGGWWWLILCAVSIYLVVWLILVVDVVDVSVVGLRPDLSGFWSTYLVLVGSTVPGDSHRQLIPATAHALLRCLGVDRHPPRLQHLWPYDIIYMI